MPTIDLVSFSITFLLGLFIVVSTSVEIFNQPSYKRNPGELYTRIKPRFVTLKKKYKRALKLYLLAIAALYSIIAFFPEVLSSFGLKADDAAIKNIISRPTWPLAAVSFVIGLQSLAFIKQFEKLCREKLHKWAKIPEGARKTIDRLKNAGFNFKLYNTENVLNQDEFTRVSKNDFEEKQQSLENKWAKVCCILFNLRMADKSETEALGGFSPSGYDTDFFDEYDEEYGEIKTLHQKLASTVSLYKNLKKGTQDNNRRNIQTLKESLEKDVDGLLERVYTFIACAVRSKQSTESEVYAILSKLGFSLPSSKEKPIDLNALITFLGSTGILITMVVLAGSYIFPQVIDPEKLKLVEYMKGGAVIAVVWAISTICCHGSAALVALCYRKCQISKGNWKEPNGTGTRSLTHYLISALASGLVGYIFLMVIVVICIELNEVSIFKDIDSAVRMFREMALQNLIWIVAIGCTGWFAVYHYDTYYEESSRPDYKLKAGLQAGTMAVLGLVGAMVYTEIWHNHNPPPEGFNLQDFMPVRLLFSSFVAGVLALMGSVMGYWFVKSNYESMFRKVRIDCRFADFHLPEGSEIYEDGKKIGANGEWISLFKRTHKLTVECDHLGEAKRSQVFNLDLVNEKSEILEVEVESE